MLAARRAAFPERLENDAIIQPRCVTAAAF